MKNGHVGALLDDARAAPAAKSDSSGKDLRPSTEAAVVKPQPYVRPSTPRSTLRPVTEANWPNANTPTVTTEDGKTYAITPALTLLREAAQQYNSTERDSVKMVSEKLARPARVTQSGAPRADKEQSPVESPHTDTAYDAATKGDQSATGQKETGLTETGHNKTATASEIEPRFVSDSITLGPMERRELRFTAALPNQDFRGHRLWATWTTVADPAVAGLSDAQPDFQTAESGLATQLYPSPSEFRLQTIDRFNFTAAENADSRTEQLARPVADGEAQLKQHPTAERWLSTPRVDIEETIFGWRITVNDLPTEPLRPAEIELPLPDDWHFPANAALSFQYRLISSSTDTVYQDESAIASATADNRFEEFDVNFRDANGTLWSVWPRLLARRQQQSYLELAPHFTPMFFSRAAIKSRPSLGGGGSIVLMIRPRTLPFTLEVLNPQIAHLEHL